MVKASAEVFKGTKYQDNWYFYHDALSLLTAKGTVDWMREKNYLKHWILPLGTLNEKTRFTNLPVGNSPEFMPLDTSLNKDVDDCVKRHIAITLDLQKDDIQKSTITTPQLGASTYRQAWEGCPWNR